MSDKVIVLWTSVSSDETNTRRVQDLFTAKRIVVTSIDASLPWHKEVRDKLFEVSLIRGKYPQIFIDRGDDNYTYIGSWEQIESLLDCDSIPEDVLAANPTIETFNKVGYFQT
jgi:hypothetical protein